MNEVARWEGGRGQLPTIKRPILCDILNLHLALKWRESLGVGGVPDSEGGYRLRGADKCFSFQSPRRNKFEWTYSAVLLPSYRYSLFCLLSRVCRSFCLDSFVLHFILIQLCVCVKKTNYDYDFVLNRHLLDFLCPTCRSPAC